MAAPAYDAPAAARRRHDGIPVWLARRRKPDVFISLLAKRLMSQRPAPLTGIRVLDLTRVLAGPWCTQNLADLGAEVITIERPGAGDDTRAWGPPYLKDEAGNDTTEAAYYLSANRNKLSVALDIASPRGAELVRELALQSDILVENFKVGGLSKYGLDYESLKELNPRLIYCSITGFGQTGPYASRPGYDFMIQGMGGLMSITGERDDLPGGGPQKAGVAVTDLMTGMYSTVGILAAGAERPRPRRGPRCTNARAAAWASTSTWRCWTARSACWPTRTSIT
jgi:crotonobetainyl-CoA:carnitine CoA-transferase CaiB-like acyl-CoA transferase